MVYKIAVRSSWIDIPRFIYCLIFLLKIDFLWIFELTVYGAGQLSYGSQR